MPVGRFGALDASIYSPESKEPAVARLPARASEGSGRELLGRETDPSRCGALTGGDADRPCGSPCVNGHRTAPSRFDVAVAPGNCSLQTAKEEDVLAIAGTGYGVIGILVIILLVVLILYFVRRA